jgi:hypothetical protein
VPAGTGIQGAAAHPNRRDATERPARMPTGYFPRICPKLAKRLAHWQAANPLGHFFPAQLSPGQKPGLFLCRHGVSERIRVRRFAGGIRAANSSGRPASWPYEGTCRVTFRSFFGQLAPLECSHRHELPGCDRTGESAQALAFLSLSQALFSTIHVAPWLFAYLICSRHGSKQRPSTGSVPYRLHFGCHHDRTAA